MSSFATALSAVFGTAPGHAKTGLEIDRFDRWPLASSSAIGYLPLATCGKGSEEEDEESSKA
jgi:hypothetical protein